MKIREDDAGKNWLLPTTEKKLPTGEMKYEGIQVYYSCFAERLQTEILLQVVYEIEKKMKQVCIVFSPLMQTYKTWTHHPLKHLARLEMMSAAWLESNGICLLFILLRRPPARPPRLHLFLFSLLLNSTQLLWRVPRRDGGTAAEKRNERRTRTTAWQKAAAGVGKAKLQATNCIKVNTTSRTGTQTHTHTYNMYML